MTNFKITEDGLCPTNIQPRLYSSPLSLVYCLFLFLSDNNKCFSFKINFFMMSFLEMFNLYAYFTYLYTQDQVNFSAKEGLQIGKA